MSMPPGYVSPLLAAVLGLLMTALPVESQTKHDVAYWRALAQRNFAVPAGESASAIARELSGLLGSADSELRDDIGYTGLVTLVYRQRAVPADVVRELMAEWTKNLSAGIGERGTDSVLKRSFSALSLGIVAALDNETQFLTRGEFDRLLDAALKYFAAERDTRGFDPAKGWMHSVAHTADLLKFLGRSRHLAAGRQAEILGAIREKLGAVGGVLTHGEDERLARVAVSIAAREDFDRTALTEWLASLAPARPAGAPTPASLAVAQNRKNLVVSLHAVLTTDARDVPGLQAAREMVKDALKRFIQ